MLAPIRRMPALALRQSNSVATKVAATQPVVLQNSLMHRLRTWSTTLVQNRPSPLMVQARQFATATVDGSKSEGDDYFSKPNAAGEFQRTKSMRGQEDTLKAAMLKRANTLPIEDWNKKDKPRLFAGLRAKPGHGGTRPADPEPRLYGTRAAADFDRGKGMPRANTENLAKLARANSGIHTPGGRLKWSKDSTPTLVIFWSIVFFVPLSIGLTHKGQLVKESFNPILKKQDWHKKKFGVNWASGGGQVPHPNATTADYRRGDSFHEGKALAADPYWEKIDAERKMGRAKAHSGKPITEDYKDEA